MTRRLASITMRLSRERPTQRPPAILDERTAKIIGANRQLADDDVLIDLGNLIVDQLSALQKHSWESCYKFAADGTFDSDLMPQAILLRRVGRR